MYLRRYVNSPNYQPLNGDRRLHSPSCHSLYTLRAPRIAVLPLREGRIFKVPPPLSRADANSSADSRSSASAS